jgi:hypothetical protein
MPPRRAWMAANKNAASNCAGLKTPSIKLDGEKHQVYCSGKDSVLHFDHPRMVQTFTLPIPQLQLARLTCDFWYNGSIQKRSVTC